MKKEIRIFFTALMFYTRIPCPKYTDHSANYLNKATRYFPLIGWIVGLISFIVFYLSHQIFGLEIAIFVAILAGILSTGAFHEDGLADVFDGFGGGWTKERILDIMKDSRVGAYGVIALIILLGLKFLALKNLLSTSILINHIFIALIFISYHALARLTAINITFISTYSRDDETSKSKPIAKTSTYKEVIGAYFFGLIPLIGLCYFNWAFILVLIPLTITCFYANYYFNKWIDGYTGDCLGAVEQIAECITILSFIAIWKFM